MNLLAFIVFGLITGIIANLVDPRPSQGGIVGSILLGIAGSLIGGFLGNALFGVGVTGFNLSSFAISILGALLVLFIGRLFTREDSFNS